MKKGGWKSFDFGPERKSTDANVPNKHLNAIFQKDVSEHLLKPSKRKKSSFNFHDSVIPRNASELAVHSKKVREVEDWLKFSTSNSSSNKKNTSFLLLTGPTGSAKTTTVNVLCRTLGISVSEWINPVDTDFDICPGPGQVSRFLEFLIESKYVSLFDSTCTKKVIVVKDFPNAFLKQPQDFFNIMEECYYRTRYPVVFICTDASSLSINLSRILFPEEILLKYSITHHTFNSCADNILKNGLKRAQGIVKDHSNLFQHLPNSTIDAIVASSMGDIRCAINQFYLASLIGNLMLVIFLWYYIKITLGSGDIPLKQPEKSKLVPKIKRKRSDMSATLQSMSRDENLGLFHGIGRVLNPKRITKDTSWRLHCDVNKLVDEFSIQPSIFTSFLFENYLQYFGDINDVAHASDVLSYSGVLLENWDRHDTLVMALSISVLGLMVYNEHRVSKWNQIRGPKKIVKSISGTMAESRLNSMDCFYYNLINKSAEFHTFKL